MLSYIRLIRHGLKTSQRKGRNLRWRPTVDSTGDLTKCSILSMAMLYPWVICITSILKKATSFPCSRLLSLYKPHGRYVLWGKCIKWDTAVLRAVVLLVFLVHFLGVFQHLFLNIWRPKIQRYVNPLYQIGVSVYTEPVGLARTQSLRFDIEAHLRKVKV